MFIELSVHVGIACVVSDKLKGEIHKHCYSTYIHCIAVYVCLFTVILTVECCVCELKQNQ